MVYLLPKSFDWKSKKIKFIESLLWWKIDNVYLLNMAHEDIN